VITSANTQTINAVNGTVNLTGDNGFQSLITADSTTINSGGGILTGDAVIGTAGTTTTVVLNNTGALTVADAGATHIHVNADTSITFNGDGSVGSVGNRLVTNTAAYVFSDADKTLALDERVGSVTVEGAVTGLNLILTDVAGGDITDAAGFTATTATLQTTDGDIILDDVATNVGTFAGLIANGGRITYTGTGATIFANLDAGTAALGSTAGVSAANGISLTTGGDTTITAAAVRSTVSGDIEIDAANVRIESDLVEAASGNIDITGTTITLAASNAAVGGDYDTADLADVGIIRTLDGAQSYTGNVVLEKNTHISATSAVDDTVLFDGTINGPGGLEIGSSPTFNDFIGNTSPLAYLILNSTTGGSTFNKTSGDPSLGSASVNLAGSFINNGIINLGVNSSNFTFIVDSGNPFAGGSIFQGGTVNNHVTNSATGSFITVFGAEAGTITFDNIPLGSELFKSYTFTGGALSITDLAGFVPGNFYYKGDRTVTFESEKERLEREAKEKASSLAYDGTVIPEGLLALTGKLSEQPGTAGGIATSTFDIVPAGQVETFTQTVFSNTIVLP
jgi:hypothetical protein